MISPSPLHIIIGLIFNKKNQILIARRPQHTHLGGYWEFPGGKVKSGKIKTNETHNQALARELKEEVGIEVKASQFFMTIPHHYSDRSVILHCYKVTDYQGEAFGCEDQQVRWCNMNELNCEDFPAANRSIINALRLPPFYVITETPSFLKRGQGELNYSFLQFRAPHLSQDNYRKAAEQFLVQLKPEQTLLVNSDIEFAQAHSQVGLHLNSRTLMHCEERPIPFSQWLAASCHNLEELKHAEKIQVDFVTLSPVCLTATHPDAEALGWQKFHELIQQTSLPVYALGGVNKKDLAQAQQLGAVGISGISAF